MSRTLTPSPTGIGNTHDQKPDNAKLIAHLLLTDVHLRRKIDNRHYDHAEILSAGDKDEAALIAAIRKRGLWRKTIVGKRPSIPLLDSAVMSGLAIVIEFFLSFIPQVDARWSAMACAIRHERLDVIDLLFEHGIPFVDQEDELRLIIIRDHHAVLEHLLSRGLDPKLVAPRHPYKSMLLEPFWREHLRTLDVLLRHGVDADKLSKDELLSFAILSTHVMSNPTDLVELLIHHGANVYDNFDGGLLVRACHLWRPDVAAMLISLGIDLEKRASGAWYNLTRPIQLAADRGWMDVVKMMLIRGVDLDPTDEDGSKTYDLPKLLCIEDLNRAESDNGFSTGENHSSPLQIAAAHENFELVRMILTYSTANVTEALRAAAGSSDIRLLEILIAHGANVRLESQDGHTALSRAIGQGIDENAQLLLRHLKDEDGICNPRDLRIPLRAAIVRGRQEWAKLLLSMRGDPHPLPFENGWSLLTVAAFNGFTEIVDMLIEHGMDPNTATGTPLLTPLQAAASQRNAETVRALLAAGADVHARSTYWAFRRGVESWQTQEETVLGTACQRSCTEVARLLVENGADLNDSGPLLMTPIRAAVEQGNLELVQYLVTSGVDFNQGIKSGFNPIQAAIAQSNIPIINFLSEKGADVTGPKSRGLEIAIFRGDVHVVERLVNLGADVNQEMGHYGYPLQAVATTDRSWTEKKMLILLDHGANVNAVGGTYGTALQAAVAKHRLSAVTLLLQQDGIDVNVRAGKYGSALDACDVLEGGTCPARYCHKSILEALIMKGATRSKT